MVSRILKPEDEETRAARGAGPTAFNDRSRNRGPRMSGNRPPSQGTKGRRRTLTMSRNFIIVLTVSTAIGLVPWLARAGDNAPGDKSSDVIPLDHCEVEYEDTTAVGT